MPYINFSLSSANEKRIKINELRTVPEIYKDKEREINLMVRKTFSFENEILYYYCNNSVCIIIFRVFRFQAKY